MSAGPGELQRSPLDAVHRRLGAKMGAFAGWDMPIQYQGTMSEHQAVRERVGVFDLSHLGKVEVRGQGAHDALQHALSNDLDRLTEVGAAQYTLCLTDDGGIVDDLIVYREDDGYLLVPNAANWPKVADAVRASDPGRTEVTPRPDIAVLAVQGPRAPELVGGLFPEAADLPYMHLAATSYRDAPARVCRTGYTGERGFELLVPGEAAPDLWEELFERGAPFEVTPVGLGGRDTLRQLAGLLSADRLIPRHGMAVYDGDRPVGEVTSGTFSPTLRQGIALAYVHPDVAAKGTELQVDVRGRRGAVTVTRPPFVDASPK
jgi:aminomethyltransferase